ncbi:MAG TPA: UDP-N-acetylmuramoyl-L-alanine--D-glutamate ligase [Anaerolineae bacterium]|jgi:UDP-N-acetylmuramoylalanine--D-glutamate ligase|nr:UDP-N-acetylmuramoyl-L-alanine--D-glutamate ligase [Anaerolineae bacterium]
MALNWRNKKVIIIGAARQGLALARYLALHNAQVTINDRRPAVELRDEMEALAKFSVTWAVGGHDPQIATGAQAVFVSGGVPLENPIVRAARQQGILVSNDTQVFMQAVPCKTIGITGSAGKTTTTTLVGRMAQVGSSGLYGRSWIGGNIGDPLINYVDEMQPSDLAIMEISSFQSELLTNAPDVAAILNITPNHLDRHGTMENYIAAKANVVRHQTESGIAILGRDDPGAWGLASEARGKLFSFGFSSLHEGMDGAYLEDGLFFIRDHGQVIPLPVADVIELRGEHNRLNVLAACMIAHAAGLSPEAMREGIRGFRGVPHRLEFVRTWRGAQWYNDSMASAPERTIAAIRSFDGPLILLLGGRDKDLPWEDLAKLVHQRVDHVVLFGEAAGKIEAALGVRIPGNRPFSQVRVNTLKEAVLAASRVAQPGFVVLLSPGGTSFDEFKDFAERGERFTEWVLEFSETLR